MAFIIDPTLAAVGKEVDLNQSPAEYTRIFEEWYKHHHLLAQATADLPTPKLEGGRFFVQKG